MLADAVDADQSKSFDVGFQFVLAGLVFFGVQGLTEWVPGGDEGRAQDFVLGHERFEFRAGLANVHHERFFVLHDVVGIGEGLQQFSRYLFHNFIRASLVFWPFESLLVDLLRGLRR